MPQSTMSSRERIRAVIARKPVDHLPLCFEGLGHPWPAFLVRRFPDRYERVSFMLGLGLDAGLVVQPPRFSLQDFELNELTRPYPDMEVDSAVFSRAPLGVDPGCATKSWSQREPGEEHPLLFREYRTPAGTLRQVVRQHEYPYEAVSLTNDLNIPVSRSREHLVKGEADLEALSYILRPPTAAQLEPYREEMKKARRFCDERGVLLAGRSQGIGDVMFWLSGPEAVLMMGLDNPQALHRYVEVVSRWNDERLAIQAEAGADLVIRRGWYESCDFWSPDLYDTFLFPCLEKEVDTLHAAGVLVSYSMNSGAVPLLPAFRRLGFDIYSNIDPALPGTDLATIKGEVGDVLTLYGGVNNFGVIEHGSPAEVRAAVFEAVRVLGAGGGYILGPGDTLDCLLASPETTEKNFSVMIEAWKECR
jgi:uroporphyrinogen-III decarboxylase